MLEQIVDFRHGQVFAGATTYTCLLFLSNARRDSFRYSTAAPPDALQTAPSEQLEFRTRELSSAPWVFVRKDERNVLGKLAEQSTPLLALPCSVSRGSSTGADDVFMLSSSKKRLFARDGEPVDVERGMLRTPLYATDFGRYRFAPAREERVIFPYRLVGKEYRVIEEDELAREFPRAYAYLRSRKKALLKRKQFKEWFGFSAPRNLELHDAAHLMVPLLARTGSFCLLPSEHRGFCPVASAGFTISIHEPHAWNPGYVLGLLNSRLLFWMLKHISNVFRGGWITCTKQYVGRLPIRILNRSNSQEGKRHDRIIELVQGMLALRTRLADVQTDHARIVLNRRIETTDRQIDELIYELYGLTDDEVRVVEEATAEP
jgi:hypothetical protein